MNIKEFRNIIREEVRKAVQEELAFFTKELKESYNVTPSVQRKDSIKSSLLSELENIKPTKNVKQTPLGSLLEETKRSMTPDIARNILGAEGVVMAENVSHQGGSTSEPGIDLSEIPFLSRAKETFKKAQEFDKLRAPSAR